MMSKRLLLLLCCLLALAPQGGLAQSENDIKSLIERLETYRYGADTAVLDAVRAQVAAARADATRRALVARELATVLSSPAAFDAKQFACRQLAFIASDEQIPALKGLLADNALGHYALMALARIPGDAVNSALRSVLPGAHGRLELEIMDTVADRGDAKALFMLRARLYAVDFARSDAAAAALAKLATPEAIEALRAAYASATLSQRLTSYGYALLDGADRLRQRGDLGMAATLDTLLADDPAIPPLRAAALRGLARARPEAAMPRILKALSEDGTPCQLAAANIARELPGARATQALSAALPGLTTRGKLLLLAALGDRGDHAAAPAVAAQCSCPDAAVRVAALQALGSIGGSTLVPQLLAAAAGTAAEERAAARDSLARLRGAEVDTGLLAMLDSAPSSVRAEIVTALGRRRATGALPRLLVAARGNDSGVRSAALHVLRELGQPAQLSALVDLLLAIPPADRDEAIDTISEIARRGTDEQQRTGVLLSRLATATKPADRVSLLTLLSQVGGPNALTALRAALTGTAPEVRDTSVALLAEWPTDEPLMDLQTVVRADPDARQRLIALRGYLRMIVANEQRAPRQTLALLRDVAPLATRPDQKRLLLAGLAKIRALEALEFASGYLQDADVRAEAEAAVVEIGASTLGAWPEKTRAALTPIAQNGGEGARKQAGAVLARLDKMGDFIAAWEVSPAYQREGVDYTGLFDIAFPPEEAGTAQKEQQVAWQPMPIGADPDHPWLLDLLALWGGEQRVAYLRTAVWSEAARDLALELGSDDGVKAWWNGQVVLAHNVARAVAPAEEKVTVSLHPGWNTLLLKITQNNQGWGACARFTAPDGKPVTGLRYSVPSAIVTGASSGR